MAELRGAPAAPPLPESFLRHVVVAPSQYDETCRTMAAELLHLRNRVETFEETEREAVANANRAWGLVEELAVIARRATNPLLPGCEELKADARAVLAKVEA